MLSLSSGEADVLDDREEVGREEEVCYKDDGVGDVRRGVDE